MNKIWGIIICAVVLSTAFAKRPDNEMPMYDGNHSPEVEKNTKYSESAAKLGWEYFHRGDADTAIKRFNQAWMFDHENVDALWGFGVVMGQRSLKEEPEKNLSESIRFLEMAAAKAPKNGRIILVDLAYSHTMMGAFLKTSKQDDALHEFKMAEQIFGEAEKADATYPLLYANISILNFYQGNFIAAKVFLEKAKKLGFKPDPSYEKDLEGKLGR